MSKAKTRRPRNHQRNLRQGVDVRHLLQDLPPVERRVICWLYGIACEPVDPEEIAERLGTHVEQVWRLASRGMEQLGFLAVSEWAA